MFTSLTGSRDGKGLLDHLFYNNLGEIISVLKRLTLMVGVDCTCTFFRDFQKIKNDFFLFFLSLIMVSCHGQIRHEIL